MKRIPLYFSTILLTAAFTGCSQQDNWDYETTSKKEQVLLSAGLSSTVTSVQTRATEGSEIAFATSNTEMKLYASATWKGHGEGNGDYKDIVIKEVKASVSNGVESTEHNHKHNPLTYATGSGWLYWDDFGAGDLTSCTEVGNFNTTPIATEGLTIYGIAVDGAAIPTQFANIEYANLKKVDVAIPTDQSKTENAIAKQDVVISNNVRKVGTGTSDDNRHKYKKGESSTNTKELVFKHIYNKITLNFKAGDGFVDKDGNAVKLDAATNVTLPNYNIKGLLDVTTGTFSFDKDANSTALTATGTITNLEKLSTANKIGTTDNSYDHSYEALTLPGREFTEKGTDEAITFTFSGNTYKVTSAEIYAALKKDPDETTDYATMKSGVHYIFNITVHKTDVQLTATIADWTDVNADLTPTNGTEGAFSTMTTNFGSGFNLYMGYASAANAYTDNSAKTGYLTGKSKQTAFVWDTDNNKYKYADGQSTVYWPDNDTYYHFRAIANGTPTTDADNGDYVTLTTKQTTTTTTESGTTTNAYADVVWGAPYTVADGSTASTIHPALGPTSNEIKLEFFHMMSEVSFIIKSESTDASQQVDLTTAPVLKLTCFNEAKLRLFDKSIDSWSDGTTANKKKEFALTKTKTEYKEGTTIKSQNYETIGAVPQKTENNKLLITANGNVYPINDLSKINVTGSNPASPVTEWKPGTKYIYTINILKTGVQITAQIKVWDEVTADETIQIQ